MALDLTQHPCFNSETRHRTGRMHLPVAPKCNVQCNYCDRKFDCANESRPGVTSVLLTPQQALTYVDRALEQMPSLKVVGIAGPGDPFANPQETMETLRLVREKYPEMLLCVATNGLSIHPYIDELARLEVSHVTLTVNAVDPAIGSSLYAWVRDGRTIYRGDSAACVLLQRQRRAISALKAHGIVVKINTIVVPGVNENHIEQIAEEMAHLKADVMNCIPLYPVRSTPFARIPVMGREEIAAIRERVSRYLPQMEHCTRCRADAAGLLGAPQSDSLLRIMQACADGTLDAKPDRRYIAVASMEGILVNQHLGETTRLWIYAPAPGGHKLIETRPTPDAGGGNMRWLQLAELLRDCHTVVVSGVGHNPRRVLEREGLRVIEMAGLISEGLHSIFRTGDVPSTMRKQFRSCGLECRGSGTGCA
jgi:nitrogen fixation protein NifB